MQSRTLVNTQSMQFTIDILLLTALYFGGVLALNTDLPYVFTIIGASVAGAAALAYFRRDRDYKEIFYKTIISAICGLVTGSVIMEYWDLQSASYMIAIYFFSSLLSLFFIRALLNLTEQNAGGFIISIFQRMSPAGYKAVPEKTETPPAAETGAGVDQQVSDPKKPNKE